MTAPLDSHRRPNPRPNLRRSTDIEKSCAIQKPKLRHRTESASRFLAVVLAASFLTQTATATPRRAWAHDGHVVDLGMNGVKIANQSPMDRLLIQEAFSRWGIAYDEGRLDVAASLFTDDAIFEVLNGNPKPIARAVGREAILADIRSAMAQQGDQRRHAISNVVIDQLTATHARAMAYGIVAVPGEPIVLNATVIYSADLEKSRGVWRFSRFVIGMDSYTGTPPDTGNK